MKALNRNRRFGGPHSLRDHPGLAILVIIGLVVTGGLVIAAFRQGGGPSDAAVIVPAVRTSIPKLPQVAKLEPTTDTRSALGRLASESRPFTIAVLSDSTGINRQGWVANLGQWLGETYDRPVSARPWNVHISPHGYDKTNWNLVREGENAPILILNASASSQKARYSLQHLSEMIPVKTVDLILVSHGHNQASGSLLSQGRDLLEALVKRYPGAAIVNIVQNPEKKSAPHRSTQDSEVQSFADFTRSRGFMTIDVHAVFKSTDYERLIDSTLYHPTIAGYNLWSDVVISVLRTEVPEAE